MMQQWRAASWNLDSMTPSTSILPHPLYAIYVTRREYESCTITHSPNVIHKLENVWVAVTCTFGGEHCYTRISLLLSAPFELSQQLQNYSKTRHLWLLESKATGSGPPSFTFYDGYDTRNWGFETKL